MDVLFINKSDSKLMPFVFRYLNIVIELFNFAAIWFKILPIKNGQDDADILFCKN